MQTGSADAPGHPRVVRVMVVDDHEVVREGLLRALTADGHFEVVASVPTAEEAMRACERSRPDVALVDLRLPDATGVELCRDLHTRFAKTALVVLSSHMSEDTVRDAMLAGAYAYLTKRESLLEVRRTLAEAAARRGPEPRIAAQLRELVVRRTAENQLTPQQERVLELCADGLTYREIGARLFISESTVRFHMQKLKDKFGARTKADLIARAIRSGAMTTAGEELALPA